MLFTSEFDGGLPVGATLQGIGLPAPLWLPPDGRPLQRSAVSAELSAIFTMGKLLGTARSLAAVNDKAIIAASPNYFVAGGVSAASNTPIQYSTDGVTWSNAGVSTGSNSAACVLWAGSRWVLAMAGATTQPHVTTGDNPNSTWTATTGAIASLAANAQNCMAYSPTLGRVVLGAPAASASVYTLDNGSTTWANRSGLASLYRKAVAWTGNVFLTANANTASASISADGISWAEIPLPETLGATQGYVASNGAGVAVFTGSANALIVTSDHGASFQRVKIPGVPMSDTWRVSYSGDRFFICTAQGVAMSFDGYNWFTDFSLSQAFLVTSAMAKKGSTFAQVIGNSANAYSFTESATEFFLPNLQADSPAASGNPIPQGRTYMRAQ